MMERVSIFLEPGLSTRIMSSSSDSDTWPTRNVGQIESRGQLPFQA